MQPLSTAGSYYISLAFSRLALLKQRNNDTESSDCTVGAVIVFSTLSGELGHVFGTNVSQTNFSTSITAEAAAIAALNSELYTSILHIFIVSSQDSEYHLTLPSCERLLDYISDSVPVIIASKIIDPSARQPADGINRSYHMLEESLKTPGQGHTLFSLRSIYLKDIYPYPPLLVRKKNESQIADFFSEFYSNYENPMGPEYLSQEYEDLLNTEIALHDRLRLLPLHPVTQKALRSKSMKPADASFHPNGTFHSSILPDPSEDTLEDVQTSGNMLRNILCSAAAALTSGSSPTAVDVNSNMRYRLSAAAIFSDGSIVVSPAVSEYRDPLETIFSALQLTVQASARANAMASQVNQSGKRLSDTGIPALVKPLFVVMIDRGGVCHAPLSSARQLYIENGFGDLYALLHDSDGSLQFEKFESLACISESKDDNFSEAG